jgi:DNA modification methylase
MPNKQDQLTLPLLEVLADAGESLPCAEVYSRVADRISLSEAERFRTVDAGAAGRVRAFDRDVRWARQRARFAGLVNNDGRGRWVITGKGKQALKHASPGIVITVFETDNGTALFASCEDAVGVIEDASVSLILTSPPYPLLPGREKPYGNAASKEHVDWLLSLAEGWKRILTSDGSVVINTGDVYESGRPSLDLYAERLLLRLVDELGYRLCQRFEWYNPSKLPSPGSWVTVRRERVKSSLERIYWLSLSDHPYADNRQVLTEYSSRMRALLAAGGMRAQARPSGHVLSPDAFSRDNGGAIPGNLITAPNTESNSSYIRACKESGLPIHPARFPAALPTFFVKYLTKRHDVVYDPLAGSGMTGEVCESLGRRWITSDRVLEYVQGSAARFVNARGFKRLCDAA